MAANLDFTQYRAEDGSNTKRRILVNYSGPASYPTGGDPLTPGELKLGQLHQIHGHVATNGTVVLIIKYDHTAQAMKWFDMAGAEIANGTDLSAYTARLEAIGL